MADAVIKCPNCNADIPLTSAIEGPIAERLRGQFEAQARAKDEALGLREKAMAERAAKLEQARETLEAQVAEKVKGERAKIAAAALEEAKAAQAVVLKDVQARLADKESKLVEAQKMELELRNQRRELEEKKEAFALEMARKMDEEREKIKAAARAQADEAHQLKEAEKEKQIGDMRRQIDELKRKAEQGSQQLQGEVLELELEGLLRTTFAHDQILPVAKGVHGGDVVQRVMARSGLMAGTILWESKRTKAWSDTWIDKAKSDQRAAKADVAIIVSMTLPKDVSTIAIVEGVWVTSRECMMGLAMALREGLLRLAEAKQAAEGKHEKMEVLYNYLSGHEFKQRVEAIVEAFSTMRADLDQERKAMTKAWAKREKQLERVMLSTSGMHGDLAGIIGGALPAIESMELPALGDGEE